ncbi:MAG: hypothetical protein ACRDJH_15750 [Thermomicrobiales bacterium]
MAPQLYALSLIEVDRVMREITEGAGPGSSREIVVDEVGQGGSRRVATARRLVGAAMIRVGERLQGRAQPDAAYSV